jgi:hypothetical protein
MKVDDILQAIEDSDDFNGFRQRIMHALDKATATDYAIHEHNLDLVKRIKSEKHKDVFDPRRHKASFIGDEFAEFRPSEGN